MPNKLLIKRQTVMKMILDLSLIACVFSENLNRRFEKEERLFRNDKARLSFSMHIRGIE